MSEQHIHQVPSLSVRSDQPLIGIILEEQGHEVVHYFTEEAVVDASASDQSIQAALNLAGAWRDLDWDEAAAELERTAIKAGPPRPSIRCETLPA